MKRDKKTRDGKIHLVLPTAIGAVNIIPIENESVILDSFAAII
jgi:3-dehydroquinate synthetase